MPLAGALEKQAQKLRDVADLIRRFYLGNGWCGF
jgi:hypothetical protein